MKIINSHYIPLPEPRWLIANAYGNIYEQLGTLTIVEDVSNKKDGYRIKTHSHPVVSHTAVDSNEIKDEKFFYYGTLTPANGEVLDDMELKDCRPICLSSLRSLNYWRFNALIFVFQTGEHHRDFLLEDFISDLRAFHIRLIFPEKELQEVTITSYNIDHGDGCRTTMLISDMTNILFVVPFFGYRENNKVQPDWDEIFLEFVNQARAYLEINSKYRFHFKSSVEMFNPLIERLNNELNDYLEREED